MIQEGCQIEECIKCYLYQNIAWCSML